MPINGASAPARLAHHRTAAARNALLHGYDKQVHVRYRNRYGRERSYYTNFTGAIPNRAITAGSFAPRFTPS